MKDIIFILIGEGVIKIQIKEFRGKKYESIKIGNTIVEHNGNKQTRL
jgi:hypothetical protein